jgi:hypothetical protein
MGWSKTSAHFFCHKGRKAPRIEEFKSQVNSSTSDRRSVDFFTQGSQIPGVIVPLCHGGYHEDLIRRPT